MVMSLHSYVPALVGRARFSPWLFKKADFQMGHLLKLALYRHLRRIRHLVSRFFLTSDTYRRFVRGSRNPGQQASTPKLRKDIESTTMRERFKKVGPSKHSAKQKAFVAALAWSVFLLLRPGKAPYFRGGLFPALKKAGGEGMGGGTSWFPLQNQRRG